MRRGRQLLENRFSLTRLILAGVFILICLAAFLLHKDPEADGQGEEEETIAVIENISPEEMEKIREEEALDEVLKDYEHLGIISVNGYINLRSKPDSLDMTNIIGRLDDGAACEILEEEGDWALIRSGGIQGYASLGYILTGEEARAKAAEGVAERVIIAADVLNIRSAPEIDPQNVVGKARAGERYRLLSTEGDWARVDAGFLDGYDTVYMNIGDGNAEIRTCLDAARKLDLRQMALTQYDNLVLAYTEGYINVREEPVDNGIGNICGKFPKGSGAEMLDKEEKNGEIWYKIKSGSVTGWVHSRYCLTGQAAKDTALDYAVLTAFVRVDALNVRSEPSLDGKPWTQITKNQAYSVLGQFDGWVELELDSSDGEESEDKAFVSTRDNNVEVRYGLPEAIEFYPAVEAANAAAAFRNSVVNYACQFLGNPYVWGGTSLTRGCDCSGFTLKVMEHFGISLPRVSSDQAKTGQKVTSDQMKPGDLVFYANKSGRVNHVGIYIGNGQIVNAASRRAGIKISRWNYRTPVAIRNVIGP